MLRDKIAARLAAQGQAPDYQRIADDVLGIRGAPPALARQLVEQALVVGDRREQWRRVGQRAIRDVPAGPGVYVFRDGEGCALYVGKALNLRRRIKSHFAKRRWLTLPSALARVETVECQCVGSEIEALLREAQLIGTLQPVVNVQTSAPRLNTRTIPSAIIRDVLLLVPSVDPDAAEIIAARTGGATLIQRTTRSGRVLQKGAATLWTFFRQPAGAPGTGHAAIVFSWLAGRGQHTTRVDPSDVVSGAALRHRLALLLADPELFRERVIRG